MCVEVPFCKIVTTTTIAVCCISWLMLKLHKPRPLVKVNQERICIENFNICVSENLVDWLIFQLQLKLSEVSFKNLNVRLAISWLMLKLHELSNTVCSISWLMLKLHELRPLVKVNQARMCIANFNICVSENLVEWLIFQLKLKMSEVGFTNSNVH